jgi:type II secretory pathway component PulJ
MSWIPALIILAAAVGLTYVTCIRPMRRQGSASQREAELNRRLAQLREEVRLLRERRSTKDSDQP